jgi:putative transposase
LSGWLYLAVVVAPLIDAWSWRTVGWAMATHLRTQLVLDALAMAIQQRHPQGIIHYSDQGNADAKHPAYNSLAFSKRCREAGVRPSMGSVGDCFDNVLCESFFAILRCWNGNASILPTETRQAVFAFIESWYYPHQLHSALGFTSPMQFEKCNFSLLDSQDFAIPQKRGNSS